MRHAFPNPPKTACLPACSSAVVVPTKVLLLATLALCAIPAAALVAPHAPEDRPVWDAAAVRGTFRVLIQNAGDAVPVVLRIGDATGNAWSVQVVELEARSQKAVDLRVLPGRVQATLQAPGVTLVGNGDVSRCPSMIAGPLMRLSFEAPTKMSGRVASGQCFEA